MHLIFIYFIFKKWHFEIHLPIYVNIVINVSPLKSVFFDLHIFFLVCLRPICVVNASLSYNYFMLINNWQTLLLSLVTMPAKPCSNIGQHLSLGYTEGPTCKREVGTKCNVHRLTFFFVE